MRKGVGGGDVSILRKMLFLWVCRPLPAMNFAGLYIFSHAISTPRSIFCPVPLLSQGLVIKSSTGSYTSQAPPKSSITTTTPTAQCKNLADAIPVYDASTQSSRVMTCAEIAGTGKCRFPISRGSTVKARRFCKGSCNAC